MLFAAVDPETRHLLHAEVTHKQNYLAAWRFFEHVREVYGRVPPIVVTDGGSRRRLHRLCITWIRQHGFRNRIELWIQELKRRIDTLYASFPGNGVATMNNWLRQFAWTWNACQS